MMALNFPDTPAEGATYTSGSASWQFDGAKWVGSDAAFGVILPLSIASGGTGSISAPAALAALGGISSNQTVTLSGAVSGSGATAIATTLATVPATTGGTGLTTYAQGDIVYASAANTLAKVAKDATATRYLSNTGTTNNPAWAAVNLANGTTGTLALGSGGTGQTSAAAALTALGGLSTTTASATYLPLAGGTMTGALTITPSSGWAVTVLNKAAATDANQIMGQRAGISRWDMQLGTANAESGGNVGSDFAIARYNDAGTWLGSVLTVIRATGATTIAGNLTVSSGGDSTKILSTAGDWCRLMYEVTAGRKWSAGIVGSNYAVLDDTAGGTRLQIDTAGACSNLTGTWATISDSTVKQDISPYPRGLQELLELSPVQFRYRPGTPFTTKDEPSPLRFGLIAEDVEPHIPEIVGETVGMVRGEEVPLKTLNNGDLVFALLNAVKELSERIVVLEDLLTGDGR